jgi:hypothetical protein
MANRVSQALLEHVFSSAFLNKSTLNAHDSRLLVRHFMVPLRRGIDYLQVGFSGLAYTPETNVRAYRGGGDVRI